MHEAGLELEQDLLRMGFVAAAAIKYVWMIPHLFQWAQDATDPSEVMRVIERRLPVMARLFALAREARVLAGAFGL